MSIINKDSQHDPNKILPIDYPWAREYYKAGVNNNWVPEEIPMQDDVSQWDDLSDAERRLIDWNLGFFSTAESLTANNLVLALYDHITAPECRQYLLRQAFEEAIHTDMFIYCCDTLGYDPDYLYSMYERVPAIAEKDEFVVNLTQAVDDPEFTIDGPDDVQALVRDLVGFYVIMEGVFFYGGFAMMLNLKRQNKMVGIGQQFEYTLRDESLHVGFGVDLINAIVDENPGVWTEEFQVEVVNLVREAVELEDIYVEEACDEDIMGISPEQVKQYVRYIADRRLRQLDLPKQYDVSNPFPWMSEATDLNKESNFFEKNVSEYMQGGALDWD